MSSSLLKTYVHLVELVSQENHTADIVGTIIDYIYRTHDKSIHSRKLVKAFLAFQTLQNFYGGLPPSLLDIRESLLERCMQILTEEEKTAFLGVM